MPPPSVPLDAIRQPAVLYDAAGRIAAANDLAEAIAGRPLLGLSAADLASICDVRSYDGAPVAAERLAAPRALAGEESVDVPIAIVLPDGRRIEILATAAPVREGNAVTGALVLWQDVTERNRAAEALRKSEEDVRSIFARSLDALYRRSLSTGLSEYYSPAIEAITGFSVEECMAMSVDDVVARIHPDDVPSVVSGKLGIPPGNREGTVDYRFRCRDGAYRWLSDRFRVERDGDGRIVAREGIIRDIDERKLAEEALRKSEEKYRALIETNVDFVWEMDAAGRYTYCSPQMERLWGIDPATMLGRTPFDLMPAGARERAVAAFTAMAAAPEGFSGVETVSHDGRGRLISLEIAGVPFFGEDGALLGYRGVTRDVTERVRAGDALRQSEERLRLAQEGAGIAIWDHDAVTDQVIVEPGFTRRYLLDPGAMQTFADWIRYIHPEDRGKVDADRLAALAAGEPLDLEFRIVVPPGETRWIQLRGRGLSDGRGALARVVGVIIDVTERKRAEEALAESEADARSFFENMVDACAVCETVTNGYGEPVDIRLVDVNPAFSREIRLPRELLVGQTAFVILPTLHREWLDLFLEIGRQQTVIRFEEPFPALGRWYHVTGFPVRGGRVAVVFRDITRPRES